MQLKFVENESGLSWRCWIDNEFGWQSTKIDGGWQFSRTLANATLTIILHRDISDRHFVKYVMVYSWSGHCFRHAAGQCETTRMEEWLSQTATELTR